MMVQVADLLAALCKMSPAGHHAVLTVLSSLPKQAGLSMHAKVDSRASTNEL